MAFAQQRFIHAANVRLDVPVSVQTSEVLSDDLRLAFEDATLTSFEFVIRSCVEHRVDFLLLSGNIFVEADRSLRARLALLHGCRLLEAKQIQVFVLPGDADPPEAWKAIPELPPNVRVCYSSSPEPLELSRADQVITTVSASLWYGDRDAFGIRVIAGGGDAQQPFRIAAVSRARYEESQRMASLAASAPDSLLQASLQNASLAESAVPADERRQSRMVSLSGRPRRAAGAPADLSELQDEEAVILPGVPPEGGHSGDHATADAESDTDGDWDAGFIRYIDETVREGQLSYLALTGQLERATLRRQPGVVHCPGTTQPRSHREVSTGCCSLVEVTAEGRVTITALDTSTVDWQEIEISVGSGTTLSAMLQTMTTRLMQLPVGPSDRIWSVHWTLRCSLPVLQELEEQDLVTAVALELDELTVSGQKLRLLHSIRLIPDAWQLADPKHLAQRYSDLVHQASLLQPEELQKLIETDRELTTGWRQRLGSLLPGVDCERILAQLRIDGAGWFIPDAALLLTDAAGSDEFTATAALMDHDARYPNGDPSGDQDVVSSVFEDEHEENEDADDADGRAGSLRGTA